MSQAISDVDMMLQKRDMSYEELTATLVNTYYDALTRLAWSILLNEDDAQDAAQETIMTAVSKIAQYEPGTQFKNWIYTICVNVCRTQLRKRKLQLKFQHLLHVIGIPASKTALPEETIIQSEGDAQLWLAVNHLKQKHRITVVLRYHHGLSIREIAQILQINAGTVRSRLHYAHRQLHDMLVTNTEVNK